MKPLALLLSLVAGQAMGQTDFCFSPDGVVAIRKQNCPKQTAMGQNSIGCVDHGRLYPKGCPTKTLEQMEREAAQSERDLEDARYFLRLAQEGLHRHWYQLMPLAEPLPPPTMIALDWGKAQECNPTDSKVGRALPLCGQPEPSVVPAIQETFGTRSCHFKPNCDTESGVCFRDAPVCEYTHHWTCSDPSRVLLHSLDGKQHWCVRF